MLLLIVVVLVVLVVAAVVVAALLGAPAAPPAAPPAPALSGTLDGKKMFLQFAPQAGFSAERAPVSLAGALAPADGAPLSGLRMSSKALGLVAVAVFRADASAAIEALKAKTLADPELRGIPDLVLEVVPVSLRFDAASGAITEAATGLRGILANDREQKPILGLVEEAALRNFIAKGSRGWAYVFKQE